jgi:hypothetical protein
VPSNVPETDDVDAPDDADASDDADGDGVAVGAALVPDGAAVEPPDVDPEDPVDPVAGVAVSVEAVTWPAPICQPTASTAAEATTLPATARALMR